MATAAENLNPRPDLVVVGNVVKKTNPEAQALEALKLPFASFPETLRKFFLEDRHSVVVSGTHGKTTTSSLLAWTLEKNRKDPSMLIGGIPENFGEGFRLGRGAHFVVEGDEYDTAYFDKVPKFLHYKPDSLIVTSVEFDHADIYSSLDEIKAQFVKVAQLVPPQGRIYACVDCANTRDCVQNVSARVVTYGVQNDDAEWRAKIESTSDQGVQFTVHHQHTVFGDFSLALAGEHNVANALATIAWAANNGLSAVEIHDALSTFRGVTRRQTVRAVVRGVRIIDDFAHHPNRSKKNHRSNSCQVRGWQVVCCF